MLIKLDLEAIKKHLIQKNFDVQYQKETNQLFTLLKVESREYPLFVRIYEEGDLLQLILFIPCNIHPGAEPEIARLLHTINKEIDIPGFGMDETADVIFYRCMLPAFDKQIEEGFLDVYLQSLPMIADSFTAVIVTAASGSATYDEIMEKMKEIQKKTDE